MIHLTCSFAKSLFNLESLVAKMNRKLTSEDVEEVLENSERQIREEDSTFHRHLMGEIDWRDRLICIQGSRGTGLRAARRRRT